MIDEFLDAVRKQDLTALHGFLARGVIADSADEAGSTALVHAAAAGTTRSFAALMAAGADPARQNAAGENALTVALRRGHREIAERLLAAGGAEEAAYAFRFLINSAVPPEVFDLLWPRLPAGVETAYHTATLAVALTSEPECRALMVADASCIGGVYRETPDHLMLFSLARLPAQVSRLYVADGVASLDFLLQNAALAARHGAQIIVTSPSGTSHYTPARRIATPAPAIIEIEPVDWCNLRCTMCHVSQMTGHASTRFKTNLLATLPLEQARLVQLGAAFEPMLNKDFVAFVSAAAKTPLSITTNGTLLSSEIIEALTAHEDVTVNVSIDGGEAGIYEKIRRNGDFLDLRRRLEALVRARDPARLRIGFSCTVMQSNLESLGDVLSLAEEIGVESVSFRPVFIRDATLEHESLDELRAEFAAALDAIADRIITANLRTTAISPHYTYTTLRRRFPDNFVADTAFSDSDQVRLAARKYPLYQLGRGFRDLRCVSPEQLAHIDANGVVSVCKGFVVGDVSNEPFESIWNGPAANMVREIVSQRPQVCEACDHFRFCLNTSARGSIQSSAFSGALKYRHQSSPVTASAHFYDRLHDHRGQDLIKAVLIDRAEWARVVLASGWDPETLVDGRRPLVIASERGAVATLRLFLEYGCSPHRLDDDDAPPLAVAALGPHAMAVALLREHGADPTAATLWLSQLGKKSAADWLAVH